MTNIGINFNFSASAGTVPSATNAVGASFEALQKKIIALNRTSLMSLGKELKGLENPRFNWDQGLRQSDKLLDNIKKSKLSAGELFQVLRKGQDDLVRNQQRVSNAFMAPLGNSGAMSMFIPATKDLQGLSNAAEIANQRLRIQGEILGNLGNKVQDWGKNTQWAGRQLMVGFTVPLGIAAAAAGSFSLDIDKAITRIEKVYDGATESIRKQSFEVAKSITQSMGTTIQSSLEVMGELAAAGKKDKELFELTYQAQKLATLGSVEQEDAIKGVIAVQNIYKYNTEQMAEAVNYLNIVEAQTPTGLKDLVDAIPIAGAQVALLGGTLQDTAVLLTAFKERGISTVEGANAIKTAMNRVLSPTKAAVEMFDKLTGKSLVALVKSTEGKPLETFQALSDVIVGSNIALADQQALITKIVGIYQSARITGLLNGLQETDGAVSKAKDIADETPEEWAKRTDKNLKAITDSMQGRFTIALESFKAEFKSFGDMAVELATLLLQGFTKVFNVFNEMPSALKWIGIAAIGFVAIAGPLTMLTGLTVNLLGTSVKAFAWLTKRKSGTQALTIAEKAAALQADVMNKKMITQVETTQILVYQMQQLQKAILGVTAAEARAAASNPLAGIKVGGQQVIEGRPGEYRTNTGRPLNQQEQQGVVLAMQEKERAAAKAKELEAQKNVTEETKRTGIAQRVFRTETMLTISAVSALGGLFAEAGGSLEKWLNIISLATLGLSMIGPAIGKIGPALRNSKIAEVLTNSSGKFVGSMKTAGTKVGSILRMAFSPVGLGIGAAILGVMALSRLAAGVSGKTEEARQRQEAINVSTDKWVDLLGRTKIAWGQIKTESGEVKDTIDSIAQAMREKMPELVDKVRKSTGADLQNVISTEVLKLQGQGLQRGEIMNSMRALLSAAGKKKVEIEAILSNLEVSFDFSGGAADLDAFIKTAKDKFIKMNDSISKETTLGGEKLPGLIYNVREMNAWAADTGLAIKTDFLSRLAGMSDAEKAIFTKKFVSEMSAMFEQSFVDLNAKAGGTLGQSFAEAREKFFNFDKGAWQIDRTSFNTANPADLERIKTLEMLIMSEQNLTKTILQGIGASKEQITNASVVADIMPFIVSGNVKAEDAQNAYNEAIKQAAQSGKAMTEEEKDKFAALVASTFGLNAATLKTNGYSAAMNKAKHNTVDNAKAIKAFAESLKNVGGAAEDMWTEVAAADAGFESLGATVQEQSTKLTDTVKDIYSGAMSDIYDAMASQAEEQWAARMDAISAGFERRKDAVRRQIEDFDKAYESRQRAFQDRWDRTMENTETAFKNRKKAIEDQADAQIASIDKQIEAIEKQQEAIEAEQEAEREREEARERAYQNELKRIERLTELANRNIDFNRALATGNLDEAARIQNNAGAITASWAFEDSMAIDEIKKDDSEKRNKQRIDELNARKETIEKQKQAKLEALQVEEQAVEKSLEKQREMQQRAMEDSRDIEKERLDNRLDSLSREQQATEAAERKKQEMNRRTLELELATLKAFVPQNEAQLNAHIARVQGVYNNHGVALTVKGGYWGQIIGNALQNNVNRARASMSNNAAWGAFGNAVAAAITNGAFGMNLGDFMKLITTGQLPKSMGGGGAGQQYPRQGRQFLTQQAFHAGGPVGDANASNRLGRTGPLYPDEANYILQQGEYVMNKDAVAKYGAEFMSLVNSGNAKIGGPGPQKTAAIGPAGIFGGMLAVGMGSLMQVAIQNMAYAAASKYAHVAPALGLTGAGTSEALAWAASQAGKPYVWGGVGPNGYDCSGFLSAVTNFLTGQSLHKRLFTTSSFQPGRTTAGFVPGVVSDYILGVRHGNPGHMVGQLGGVNLESRGGRGVLIGDDADSPLESKFPMKFSLPMEMRAAFASAGSGASGPVKEIVRAVVDEMFGWGAGAQWSALDWLVQKESSWNPRAQNPVSTAYGLFQFLNSTWGGVGATKTSDPRLQAIAGGKYIKQRYGSPIAAQSFHMRNNWYDGGGDLRPGLTMAYNGTNRTETILSAPTRDLVVDALRKAMFSYDSLADVRKTTDYSGLASNQNVVNNYDYSGDVVINGAQFSMAELTSMVKDVMINHDRKKKQRLGEIK